jgi:hypothetical protein
MNLRRKADDAFAVYRDIVRALFAIDPDPSERTARAALADCRRSRYRDEEAVRLA